MHGFTASALAKRANGAHAFVAEDVAHDFFAVHFQTAIAVEAWAAYTDFSTGDKEKFQALCLLGGGKPGIIEDFSASSSSTVGSVPAEDIKERMQYCQPVDTQMGMCTVGGAAQHININGFKVKSSVTATPPPPPPLPPVAVV
ncbi:hypothetical protein CYMTET_7128 [Cymbomonas tetramitiformis]|uniref:Uncharacterized protein n=1 Tax=Cymbomonas tetramitiformis TaxID=36881 RepID=A0AAE0LHB2_9CHLO|nr:hypothetical protein CYMTET_7128 [Cymbomonas tetramitiformis]